MTKKFNLNAHIKDHADFYFNSLRQNEISVLEKMNYFSFFNFEKFRKYNENFFKNDDFDDEKYFSNRNNLIHFTISFNLLDFVEQDQEEVKELLQELLINIANTTLKVTEKNGWRNGIQRYRTRKIKIGELLTAGAVHLLGVDDNYLVNPHIHLVFDKKARLGKNFIYLKQAIVQAKNKIKKLKDKKTSFEQKENKVSKKFKNVMSARAWAIRKNPSAVTLSTLIKFRDDVIKYIEKSGNWEYLLKSIFWIQAHPRGETIADDLIVYFLHNFKQLDKQKAQVLFLKFKQQGLFGSFKAYFQQDLQELEDEIFDRVKKKKSRGMRM